MIFTVSKEELNEIKEQNLSMKLENDMMMSKKEEELKTIKSLINVSLSIIFILLYSFTYLDNYY